MSPDEIAAFRAKIDLDTSDGYVRGPNAAPAAPTPPLPTTGTDETASNSFRAKLNNDVLPNLEHFANGPAMQGLGAVMNPSAGMLNTAMGSALEKSGIGQRQGAFTREVEGDVQHVDLKPMYTPDVAVPTSPTLASGYGRPSAASVGSGMGGSGGMAGLQGAVRQAQSNQLGTWNRQVDLVERRGELQSDRIGAEATMQELNAARQQRDVEVQQKHDAEALQKHEAFLARNQELANDIGAQKIDPQKVIGDMGAGQKIGMVIAGILSGAAGQGGEVLRRLDSMVSEGVKAQMANVDNKKAALGARQNLFGQMMAESGDRRVAESQTRNLIWESIKQEMGAKAARLGIPEVQNNAEMTMAEIQASKQDPLQTHIAETNLANAKAAAAAAAAAQRAAEDRAWSRGMQTAELGLKQDAQNIEREKLAAKDKDDINAETSKLGAALADPKLANGRAAVENSKRRLGIAEDGTVKVGANGKPVVDQDEGLPGVGAMADFRDRVAGRPQGANALNPMAWVTNRIAGLSDDERVARGDWDKMALAYQVQVTGSGGSEEQMKQIRSAFAGAKTAKEQRNAVAEADAVFKQIESRTRAGASPAANRAYDSRLNNLAPQMPGSVTVKR